MTDRVMQDWIYRQSSEMVETAVGWSNINSGTGNPVGIEQMFRLISAELTHLGFAVSQRPSCPVERIDDRGDISTNSYGPVLIARLRPELARRFVLAGHVDTVYPVDHPFQTVSRLPDGRLNGPGIADMKGGLVVLLHALSALEHFQKTPDVGFDVIINSDEETGSLASATLLQTVAQDAEAGFVVEPALADGQLAGARGGSCNLDIIFRGRAAHAGRAFHDGRNAIVSAARFIMQADALNGQRDRVTINVGLVRGGETLNAVPDTACVRVNLRAPETGDMVWAYESIHSLASSLNGDRDIAVSVHGTIHRPPKPMTAQTLMMFERLQAVGDGLDCPVSWSDTGGVCDGNNLAEGGLPVIDTLGVRGGAIHSSDEFAVPDSFPERTQLLAELISSLHDAPLQEFTNREGQG